MIIMMILHSFYLIYTHLNLFKISSGQGDEDLGCLHKPGCDSQEHAHFTTGSGRTTKPIS